MRNQYNDKMRVTTLADEACLIPTMHLKVVDVIGENERHLCECLSYYKPQGV